MIIPKELNIKKAFKWMYHSKSEIIIICENEEYHSNALRNMAMKEPLIPSVFEEWVRIINLQSYGIKKLCVRAYPENLVTKDKVTILLRKLKFRQKIEFDIDNDRLKEITGDYFRKW